MVDLLTHWPPPIQRVLCSVPNGSQPGRGPECVDDGARPPGGDQVENEAGQWFGQHDGGGAQLERDLACAGVDVADGEEADGCEVLGVEEEQQSDDPVGGFQRAVLQEPACVVPAFLAVVRAPRASHRTVPKVRRLACRQATAQRMKWPVSSR
jgi:hypothetical protein